MGGLNWNLDVILGLICSFIVYYTAFLTFKRFNRKKFEFVLYQIALYL